MNNVFFILKKCYIYSVKQLRLAGTVIFNCFNGSKLNYEL